MLSEVGMQRATDPELKKFSREMYEEHTKMNQELTALAAQKRVGLPRTLDVRAQFCIQALKAASGDTFDRCYAKAQLCAHIDAIGAFEAESERGQDPQIRALAAKALPQIKEHFRMIKPIVMRLDKEFSDDTNRSNKDEKSNK